MKGAKNPRVTKSDGGASEMFLHGTLDTVTAIGIIRSALLVRELGRLPREAISS